jgi:aryl-alcohol dehydrogenase-like predicted oxidoreductase
MGAKNAEQSLGNVEATVWKVSPEDYDEIDRPSLIFTDTLQNYSLFLIQI